MLCGHRNAVKNRSCFLSRKRVRRGNYATAPFLRSGKAASCGGYASRKTYRKAA